LTCAKTIEVYMSRLCQKVGCHSCLELVLMAERGQKDLSLDVQVPTLEQGHLCATRAVSFAPAGRFSAPAKWALSGRCAIGFL
jgi:hypothetical protein